MTSVARKLKEKKKTQKRQRVRYKGSQTKPPANLNRGIPANLNRQAAQNAAKAVVRAQVVKKLPVPVPAKLAWKVAQVVDNASSGGQSWRPPAGGRHTYSGNLAHGIGHALVGSGPITLPYAYGGEAWPVDTYTVAAGEGLVISVWADPFYFAGSTEAYAYSYSAPLRPSVPLWSNPAEPIPFVLPQVVPSPRPRRLPEAVPMRSASMYPFQNGVVDFTPKGQPKPAKNPALRSRPPKGIREKKTMNKALRFISMVAGETSEYRDLVEVFYVAAGGKGRAGVVDMIEFILRHPDEITLFEVVWGLLYNAIEDRFVGVANSHADKAFNQLGQSWLKIQALR